MATRLRLVIGIAALWLVGCLNPFAPAPIPSETWVEISPLSGYPAEFERMRACTSSWIDSVYSDSLAGDVQRFYMVQRGDVRSNGIRAAAVTGRDSLGVYIAIAEGFLRDKDVVRHEMIHAIQNAHPALAAQGWHNQHLFSACNVPITITG